MQTLLTPTDAGRILGISPQTVKYRAEKGYLKAIRLSDGDRVFRHSDLIRHKEQFVPKKRGRRAAKEAK
jgi:DNA-binding transcriptional MerR regulator